MFIKIKFLSVLAIGAVLVGNAAAEVRTWTGANGKKVTAEMISSNNETVRLKYANGKESDVKLNSLSEDDRNYIRLSRSKEAGPVVGKNNFDAPWPSATRGMGDYEVVVIKEEEGESIFETPHFRFMCNAPLSNPVRKKISTIFEATYEANKALPINNMISLDDGDKFPAKLLETQQDYAAAGGLPNTSGVFIYGREYGRKGIVIVPYEALSLKKTTGGTYTYDIRNKDVKTLIHEITHQMMPHEVKAEAWFCEGSAEYVAITPYYNIEGRFSFKNTKRHLIPYVTEYGRDKTKGRALGKDIKSISLEKFMTMPYMEFTASVDANKNYGIALLLAYYFYHGDGEGDAARIKNYVKALQEGKPPRDARSFLLDGRTYEELEKEISTYWKKNKINLEFVSS